MLLMSSGSNTFEFRNGVIGTWSAPFIPSAALIKKLQHVGAALCAVYDRGWKSNTVTFRCLCGCAHKRLAGRAGREGVEG